MPSILREEIAAIPQNGGPQEDHYGLDPGCVRLMEEVIIRAVQDLFGTSGYIAINPSAPRHISLSAHRWLFEDDDPTEPYSFPWICDVLGLDRERFLSRLRTQTVINNKGRKFYYKNLFQ